jgi:hypothetical protein
MRPSKDPYWHMMSIRKQEMLYTLNVTTNTSLATLSKRSNTVKSFTLIEAHSAAVANDNTVSARILGNLTSYFPFPDLSVGFMFMMRELPSNGRFWGSPDLVILPDNMTSVDGMECDKVGLSYLIYKYASPASDGLSMHRDLLKTKKHTPLLAALHRFVCVDAQCLAFGVVLLFPMCHVCSGFFSQLLAHYKLYLCGHSNQGNRCSKPPGACLQNQLHDLITEDTKRWQDGKPYLYMAQRFARFGSVHMRLNSSAPSNDQVQIKYSVPLISDTTLHLEFAADDLSFIPRDPSGEVCHLTPRLCHFALTRKCRYLLESVTASANLI